MNLSTLFRIGENLNLDRKTLINLRWIAIFGQFAAINVVYFYLNLDFPIKITYLIITIGLITNVYLQFKIKASELKEVLKIVLKHDIILATPGSEVEIKSVGIITGGANSDWKLAAEENLDAYITGEISEYDWHESKEAGVHMFAGGHHATERFGIQSLQQKVMETFPEIECFFIDSANPA